MEEREQLLEKRKAPSLRHLTARNYGKLKNSQRESLQELTRQHTDSFNFMVEEGLSYAVENLPTYELKDPQNRKISFFIEEANIGYPSVPETNVYSKSVKIYPSECRQRGASYKAKLSITFKWLVDGQPLGGVTKVLGQVPIMVKSERCRLRHLAPKELVRCHEEAEEFGGYFIINGNERIIRMLVLPRRNYAMGIVRQSWKGRGPMYTEYGISIRCVRKDQTAANLTLHYLTDGSCILQFSKNKQLFYVPVILILKALMETTDVHIYNDLVRGSENDTFLKGCVASMLRTALSDGLATHSSVLKFLGERFRPRAELPDWISDEDVTRHLLNELVLVHLNKNVDKFNMLIFMTRKLYALVSGKCAAESADSPSNQEILLGGHFYLMVLKEKLDGYLQFMKSELEKKARINPEKFDDNLNSLMNRVILAGPDIGQQMEYMLATGNLRSRTGLGFQQQAGFTVVAEKLNFFRYLSHFRAVHRGAFFSEMRTTSVRKLLPEAWGFLCPVHTPDGAPCGLLNHLAAASRVTTATPNTAHLPRLLTSLGMTPLGGPRPSDSTHLPVLLDGRLIGEVEAGGASELAMKLRTLKTLEKEKVPQTLEIGLVPLLKGGQYPGLFLFSGPARMVRPVVNLATNIKEMIGSFEQVYMDIAVILSEAHKEHTTHLEIGEDSMLSALATLTPFSDFNQSPRNMYQCQMGKQTMGTPVQSFPYRMDFKMYRLQTPQAPMVRTSTYDLYGIDEYPLGTNAVVAVISYTGYDMEDAMILNKASVERGLAHASVYKCELIDLSKTSSERGKATLQFGVLPGDRVAAGKLEDDGFPAIGTYLQEGDPFYSYIDLDSGTARVEKYKSVEPAYVDQVKFLGSETGDDPLQRAYIKLRVNRNPIIGDKFASRAGQKGICSQKWPTENMPFTESGMVPDIIFNPHGFPSRMTIGMMIETMAGKSAALHGLCHDCSPFNFSEDTPAVDHFGKLLLKAGYNYFGNERMYSGIDGREFEADIFFGVVYYQRLRHMVSDKFQVRTTGPIDILTHQPVKGRKRAGGIRFGEMERDSLLAHGSSFLLQDRLLNCSDRSFSHMCRTCGSILSPVLEKPSLGSSLSNVQPEWKCRLCEDGGQIDVISVPYVFRYLVAELAAVNIKVKLETS